MGDLEVGVGVGEGGAPLGGEDDVVVVVGDQVAGLGGATAEAAGGTAVVGVEVRAIAYGGIRLIWA